MMRPDIDAIKTRCERATMGPWTLNGLYCVGSKPLEDAEQDMDLEGADANCACVARSHPFCDTNKCDRWENDREFISHAREDVPALLAWIAILESRATKAKR
jgi:hypothetical protein